MKALASVALLGLVLAACDPARILPALAKADPWWLAAGTAMWIVIQLLNVWKWWLLGRAQGLAVGYRKLLDIYFIGMFFNTFLPSGFGGDALRAYELSKLTAQGGGGSTASVIIDRFTSLYALCLVAAVALALAPKDLQVIPGWAASSLVAVGTIGVAALLKGGWPQALAGLPAISNRPRVARFVASLADGLAALRSAPTALLVALAISVAFQFLAVVLHYWFILALGLDVSFAYTAFFFPVLSLAASLPITINGLAIREGGFAFFLGKVGIPPAEAVSVGLLSLGMLLLSGLWGAIVFAGFRRSQALRAVAPPPLAPETARSPGTPDPPGIR